MELNDNEYTGEYMFERTLEVMKAIGVILLQRGDL